MMKKFIIFLTIIGLFVPIFSFAQNGTTSPPEDWGAIKNLWQKTLEKTKDLPQIIKNIFTKDVLPVWEKMYNWFKINILAKLSPNIREEIEKKKPVVVEEFQKEKVEMKEDLPNAKTTILNLWQKIKDLLK
jgi:hypothetical protein